MPFVFFMNRAVVVDFTRRESMSRQANGTFRLAKDTPKSLRIFMGEGHRLPDSPTLQQLHYACVIGCRIGHSRRNKRVKCPSRLGPNKRWTTLEAYEWYLEQINGESE